MDWDDFEVITAVVHYVPTERDEEHPVPLLTDEAIDLDAGLQAYFRDKIADRLKHKSLEIVPDPDPERSDVVPDGVRSVLGDPTTLVEVSKAIATHLDAIQSGVNSSGLLAFVLGSIGGVPCVAIVKLERERGIRFAIDTVDGRHVVDLELLRNLTLTDKTKVYKTAVLHSAEGTLAGFAADDQRGSASGTPVASFFLAEFLGCKPKEPAAEITYKFVQAANASVNADVASPERQGRYQVALLAALQDNRADLCPREFAAAHLQPVDRPAFLARVSDAGIDPNVSFAKDTSLVKIEKFRMSFQSGMVLVGSREALENNVELPADDDQDAGVKLNDSIRSLLTGR